MWQEPNQANRFAKDTRQCVRREMMNAPHKLQWKSNPESLALPYGIPRWVDIVAVPLLSAITWYSPGTNFGFAVTST